MFCLLLHVTIVMKSRFTVFAILSVAIACPVYADDQQGDFEPLFNGHNLDNWVLTNTAPETWTVKDSMLICSGKPYGEIRTREMYQNFVLEVEWRHLVPGGNAGIFLWADDIPSQGVPFHRGIEVQILEHAYGNTRSHTTHGDIFPIHGAKMTPDNGHGGSRAFPTEMRGRPAPEWNHYRITCNDGTVTLELNGKKVTSGSNCTPQKGYLCLESEGGIVHYRNVRIRILRDTLLADKARDIAIASRGYNTIYTGLNLSGWSTAGSILTDETESHGWKAADWKLQHSGSETELSSMPLSTRTGFLLDVRRTATDASAKIVLREEDHTTELVTLAAEGSTSHMNQKPGQWSRIEYDWNNGNLQLRINGAKVTDAVLPKTISPKAVLVLQGTGSLDFTNLFAR